MKAFLKNMKARCQYGAILMSITIVGIPFIPFVPLTVLMGCWKIDQRTHGSGSIGEMLGSVGLTFIVGFILYVIGFLWMTVWLFS